MNGLDLFSGIGGLTKALEGYVWPVAYCENDRYAQSVLLQRIVRGDLPPAPIWDDVRTLHKWPMLPSGIDIIYGGFPCQDISVAGCGEGLAGERSGLFFEVARLVGEIRPRFVFLENVAAITVRGGNELLENFASSGMTVAGEFYPLRMWARITDERDGGYWRTPLATDGEKAGHGNLPHQAKWATPSAADAIGSPGGGQGRSLRTDIHNWKKSLWPTPTGNANNDCPSERKRKTPALESQVKMYPTPQARDWKDGHNPQPHGCHSESLPVVINQAHGGNLNPTWVEWLMGYSSEWTVLEDWATQWYRPKRGKPSKG